MTHETFYRTAKELVNDRLVGLPGKGSIYLIEIYWQND